MLCLFRVVAQIPNIINKQKYDFNQKFKTNEDFDKFYDDNRNNPEAIDKNLLPVDKQIFAMPCHYAMLASYHRLIISNKVIMVL